MYIDFIFCQMWLAEEYAGRQSTRLRE